MTDSIDWRAKTAREIVDIVEEGRVELERRRNEALESLEIAFGAREPQPRIETRGRKTRTNGSEFPEHARGALDTAGEA
jgi:hypothetical protein